jgi:hypothetical protein
MAQVTLLIYGLVQRHFFDKAPAHRFYDELGDLVALRCHDSNARVFVNAVDQAFDGSFIPIPPQRIPAIASINF